MSKRSKSKQDRKPLNGFVTVDGHPVFVTTDVRTAERYIRSLLKPPTEDTNEDISTERSLDDKAVDDKSNRDRKSKA